MIVIKCTKCGSTDLKITSVSTPNNTTNSYVACPAVRCKCGRINMYPNLTCEEITVNTSSLIKGNNAL